jgi:hypothetical protein
MIKLTMNLKKIATVILVILLSGFFGAMIYATISKQAVPVTNYGLAWIDNPPIPCPTCRRP